MVGRLVLEEGAKKNGGRRVGGRQEAGVEEGGAGAPSEQVT